MANIKDFAVGLVVTPPSPATTGTTLTLRTGEGATMPAVPFYVTGTPPGQLTTLGTSEKLLVTGVSGDTLTFTRAQGSTTAKSIAANWIIANAMYVDDVMSSSITIGGSFTGTVNGTNLVFTTATPVSSIAVFKNGVRMRAGSGNDYVFSNNNTVTFEAGAKPMTGDVLTYDAILGASVMVSGSNSLISDEVPTGTVNGSTVIFTASRGYIAGSLEVFINGIKQARGTHFTETSPTAGTFTMGDAPLTGDNIIINYQFVTATLGNADTVDSYNAAATPTANMIPVLDSNAKLPSSTMNLPVVRWDNTTKTSLTGPRIEAGWIGAAFGSAGAAGSGVFTFDTPFTTRPIVTAVYGGDQLSGTVAYGSGGNTVHGVVSIKIVSVTTTGFTWYVHTANAANWSIGNIVYLQWMAVGV